MPSLRPGGTGNLLLLTLVGVAMLANSLPATATLSPAPPVRWPDGLVCIENRLTRSHWPVETAARRFHSASLYVVVRSNCRGYSQKVQVVAYSERDRYCGKTTTWRDARNHLLFAAVSLNTYYRNCLSTPNRRAHVVSHELGHAFGLPHTRNPNSVMSVATWSYDHVPYPSAADRTELTLRYP
jgi:hypothetical protein